MTPATAKKYALVGVGGAAALAAIGQMRDGEMPSFRIAVGGLGAAVILTVAAEVIPDLAGAFALLLLVAAAFALGGKGWEGISRASGVRAGSNAGPPIVKNPR